MNIDKLQRRVEDRREERARIAACEQGYMDHVRTISEAPERTPMDFWCKACAKDFTTLGKKIVRSSGRWPVAWYVGLCPKNHESIRYITDKDRDPYYWMSDMVKKQRSQMADDFLTPDDPRFAVLYPHKYRELQAMREQNGH